jgi:Ulp1 family protease
MKLSRRLWLKELEEKFPELAKQVHVFSSFFYKKLNKKKYVILLRPSGKADRLNAFQP